MRFSENLYCNMGNKSNRFHPDRNICSGVAFNELKINRLNSNFTHVGETSHVIVPRRMFTRWRLVETKWQRLRDPLSLIITFGADVNGRAIKVTTYFIILLISFLCYKNPLSQGYLTGLATSRVRNYLWGLIMIVGGSLLDLVDIFIIFWEIKVIDFKLIGILFPR